MALPSCPTYLILYPPSTEGLYTDVVDFVSTIRNTVSPMLLTTPSSGSDRRRSAPRYSPPEQGTIQNDENSTWFKLTKNYQEVKDDE